ncbi:MAG: RidA family protein [Saccharothrix sp.]|nr:RidA family protein [Saccharothrix sp.]
MEPQRSVDELITLYEIEPDLREVITEGRVDAALFEWFFDQIGINVPVFSVVDRVDVPDSDVLALGQDTGNRGSVVAVAARAAQSELASKAITLVVDADFDTVFDTATPTYECLLVTDYKAIELYCFNAHVFEKFLRVGLRARDVNADLLIADMESVLRLLFVARWKLKSIDNGVPLIAKIESRLKDTGGALSIDIEAILRDSLNSSGTTGWRPDAVRQVAEEVEQAAQALGAVDRRFVAHEDDFVTALTVLLRKRFGSLLKDDRKAFKEVNTVRIALRTCLEASRLREERLFKALVDRVA